MKTYKEQTQEIIRKTNINRKNNKIFKKSIATICSIMLMVASFSVIKQFNKQNDYINNYIQNENGFVIPYTKVEPIDDSSLCMNMALCVVYNKRLYISFSSSIVCSIAEKDNILGEKIGKGSGTIDEFSLKDEYDKNLASNCSQDFYTVKGYDSDFMLCTYYIYENECYIDYFETIDGKTLSTGEDLLGEKGLNLKGNYDKVYIQNHDDWNENKKNLTEIQIDDKTVDLLYSSEFVKYDGDLYDLDQIHIFIEMKDGRKVMLRYFEGGYIGYDLANGHNLVIKVDQNIGLDL